MSITRPICRPITRPLTRPLTSPGGGGGGGGVSIVSDGVLAPFVTFTRASTGTYFDSAGVMQTAAVNEPRIDYDPATGELRGLLVEEQRTNLLPRSQEFDNASWSKVSSSVSANAAVAPDGTLTADKIIVGSGVDNGYTGQSVVKAASAVQYTGSVYAKKGEWGHVGVYLIGEGFTNRASCVVNLDTGAISIAAGVNGTFTGASAVVTNVGGGWYRIALTATTGPETSVQARVYPSFNNTFPNGDGASGIFIWGAQLEAGDFATSYIPTEGTAVTRAIDDPDFTIPDGIVRLEYTYDDDTTANVAVTPGAAYQIPTGQKRIKHLRGYRS